MELTQVRQVLNARLPDVVLDLRRKAHNRAPDTLTREPGLRVVNAADDDGTAVLRIYDEVWLFGVTAADVVATLDTITAPRIRVEINSPGGDVFDGVAIYNALRMHKAHVTTRIDGIAASIASVIAQAGDHRQILSSAQMMIHNAWGMTVGDHRDHEEMASLLGQQDEVIAGVYASRSGRPVEEFRPLMDAETWLTDRDTVDAGLADEIVEPEPKPAPQASAGDTRGTITVERRLLLARHDLTVGGQG